MIVGLPALKAQYSNVLRSLKACQTISAWQDGGGYGENPKPETLNPKQIQMIENIMTKMF
jgi:hypothetical protein